MRNTHNERQILLENLHRPKAGGKRKEREKTWIILRKIVFPFIFDGASIHTTSNYTLHIHTHIGKRKG